MGELEYFSGGLVEVDDGPHTGLYAGFLRGFTGDGLSQHRHFVFVRNRGRSRNCNCGRSCGRVKDAA